MLINFSILLLLLQIGRVNSPCPHPHKEVRWNLNPPINLQHPSSHITTSTIHISMAILIATTAATTTIIIAVASTITLAVTNSSSNSIKQTTPPTPQTNWTVIILPPTPLTIQQHQQLCKRPLSRSCRCVFWKSCVLPSHVIWPALKCRYPVISHHA